MIMDVKHECIVLTILHDDDNNRTFITTPLSVPSHCDVGIDDNKDSDSKTSKSRSEEKKKRSRIIGGACYRPFESHGRVYYYR
jgi:hypothetical protein